MRFPIRTAEGNVEDQSVAKELTFTLVSLTETQNDTRGEIHLHNELDNDDDDNEDYDNDDDNGEHETMTRTDTKNK